MEQNLQKRIEDEMHTAMKAHDELVLSTLRMVRSAISNRVIEKRARAGDGELTEEEVVAVIRTEAKRRRDAMSEFTKAGRADLAEKEGSELGILERYLPAELSDEELESIVREVVSEMGGVSENDFGRAMGAAVKKVAGRASGNRVQEIVRKMMLQ